MMQQTPVHEQHNDWLLNMMPLEAKNIIEVGSSSGVLAREYKKRNPLCHYIGIEIDESYAALSKRYCDDVQILNLDEVADSFFENNRDRDCWVFGDILEHLKDPWRVIKKIRENLPPHGSICACIPNMQHWEIQAKISIGDLRYVNSGLLDLRFKLGNQLFA
jgi:tRNA A58 N-methylase Trm61